MRIHSRLALMLVLIPLFSLSAQDTPSGKVHGYVFGDYYYMIAADTAATRGSGQYSSTPKDFQAFQFRRLYLYYDHTFNEKFFAQFLLEGNDKVFDSGGRHGIFIKTAYLEWKDLIPMGSLAFGLVPTPTWVWGLSERTWAHRFVEKTITDFRGLGRASDIGVAVRGKFVEDGTLGYNAMIGNGRGQGEEKDKYKNFYGAINAKPTDNVLLEVQAEFEPAKDDKNRILLKGFAAYQTKEFTVGAEIVQRTLRKAGAQNADVVPFGISLFAWAKLTDDLNGFARFDYFDPNTNVNDAGFKENFFLIGIDYMPLKDIHIAPNLWINTYSNKSTAPGAAKRDADVVARLTFFYVYK